MTSRHSGKRRQTVGCLKSWYNSSKKSSKWSGTAIWAKEACTSVCQKRRPSGPLRIDLAHGWIGIQQGIRRVKTHRIVFAHEILPGMGKHCSYDARTLG